MANLLIVDDDLDLAEGLSILLQDAGHFVRKAHTGEEGLHVLRDSHLPDCVLLDIDMPVLTGPQMAHEMLLHDAGEELVPVILLSGNAHLTTIAERIGTPYFLAKPFAEQVLLDLVNRAVRERVAPTFPERLDAPGMRAALAGRPVEQPKASPLRSATDENLRDERVKADASRRERRAIVEGEADEVVRLARRRADAVVSKARSDEAATESHPVTEAVRAETNRKGRAADVVTTAERATADDALRRERAENQRTLDAFLAAERALTNASLDDERLNSDVTVTSRDEFLGMVSHDLRNLLAGMSLTVTQLTRSAPPGEPGTMTRKWTASIQRLIDRMTRLIGDLLDVTSIESRKLRIDSAPADARQVLAETVEAFSEIAQAKGIALSFDEGPVDAAPLDASFDRGRIMQVLANLLSNAIKFTPEGGRIVVRVARLPDSLQFSVADTGQGIPPELLTAIFERYRQIRADRRGLGLGLYIARSIVEAHGGTIRAESQLGRGSTFYFTLPLEQVKHEPPPVSSSAEAGSASSEGGVARH